MVIDQKFVGKEYTPVTYEVGREKVKEFLSATKANLAQFSEVVPPTFPVVYSATLLSSVLYDEELNLNLRKLVHGEQEFIYHKPVSIGDTVTSTGKIDQIFQKGPHDFVVFKTESSNQHGERVCDQNWTFVVRGGNDKDFTLVEKLAMKINSLMPSSSSSNGSDPHLDLVLFEDGEDRERFMKVFINKYMPQIYAGASGDFNAIHLDESLGKSVGLGGNILHGMATMALGANFAMKGKDPKSIKRYKARFSAPVKPLDFLNFKGTEDPESKLMLFEAKNKKGAPVLSSCTVEFE